MLHAILPIRCIGCKAESVAICARCVRLARRSLSSPAPYVISVFDYRDPLIKQAIHSIKYHHRSILIYPLAHELAKILMQEDRRNWVLAAMPQARTRTLMRGYNHAEKIASAVSEELGLPLDASLLLRTRRTKRQAASVSRKERFLNQKDSFAASQAVSGKNIILIDDVTTTGATAEEARSALLRKGAKDVLVATLAH